MGVQSGANLTGVTVSSQSHELKTSSITDHDATTTPPPTGGGSEAGAQESFYHNIFCLLFDIQNSIYFCALEFSVCDARYINVWVCAALVLTHAECD